MKITYIVSLFPSLSETFILREIEELTNLGYDISVISLKRQKQKQLNHAAAKKFKKVTKYPKFFPALINLLTFTISHPIKFIKVIGLLIQYNKRDLELLLKSIYILPRVLYFKSIITKNNAQHIHAHWATIPTTAAWIIHYLTDIPYSFTAHAWDIWNNNEMLPKKIKDAKFTATISNYNKQLLSENLTQSETEKIKIVHCGIDVEQFQYNPPRKYEQLKIISIGRFVEKKGFTYLIKACQKLKEEKINFKCIIVGDGPLRSSIIDQIKTLGLMKDVLLTGALPQNVLKEKLKESHLFVLPAVKAANGDLDGIPVVLMEAMAQGLPVISTKVSGIPELIKHNNNGLLVEQKNVDDLVESIMQFAPFSSKNIDFAKKGRETIEKEFNISRSAKIMDRFFQLKLN